MSVAFMTGRFIFGGFFIMNGIHHLLSSRTLAQYAAAKGVPTPEAAVVLTGLLILFGGVCIVLGWRPELGIGAIALFLIGVTPVMHNFWVESGRTDGGPGELHEEHGAARRHADVQCSAAAVAGEHRGAPSHRGLNVPWR